MPLETRDSMGFLGYRYERGKHYAMPIYADGGPSQLIEGKNLYHDMLSMRTFPGAERIFSGYTLAFTSGGTHEVIAGDTLTGATSGATMLVESVVLTSGSWAAGTAAGYFYITDIVGVIQDENLNEGANPNVCTVTAASLAAVRLGTAGKYSCVGAFTYIKSDGSTYIILCYPNKIYAYAPGNDTPYEIQAAMTLTGTNENYFTAAYWADTGSGYDPWIILTNGVDPAIYWDGDLTTGCQVLGGTPPVGRYLTAFNGHLFMSDITSGGNRYHQRDQRSDADAVETWAGGLSGSNDLRQKEGAIIGNLVYGDIRYIFKEFSTSVNRGTGYDPPFTYDEDELPIGCLAPGTICKALKYDYGFFMGHDQNLYLLRKDGGYVGIGESIRDQIRDWPNDDKLRYSFALYHPGLDQIVLAVPENNSANYCQVLFLFDIGHYIRTGGTQIIWSTPIRLPFSVTAGCPAKFREPYTIGDLGAVSSDGTIGGLSGAIGSLFMEASFSEIILASTEGYVYRFDENLNVYDDVDITWELVTKDNHLVGDMTSKFRLQEYQLWFRNAPSALADCNVSISLDGGNTWTAIGTLDMFASGAVDEELYDTVYLDKVCTKHRIKLSGTYPAQVLGQRWFGTIEGRM